MNDYYFRGSADASQLYRPSAAVGSVDTVGAAVSGNLSDFMKNSTVYRVPMPIQGTIYYPETSVAGLVTQRS
ncbi:hypothetical protein D8I24_6488 [Cupriavidus necator H850]|uniref:hypothetical protein n=1 Tax=Cupriavidus TaxID=106589 RepID=UPI00129D9804|nr:MULTISPECIES: hypothetical protein [Cupriavidus]KAI3597672.1 hypothetical protein D8I24_6488 [Cupriavidus necator H850]QUN29511.1 hypothetical protein KB879_06065 [Cupriavidus sp. KK10]